MNRSLVDKKKIGDQVLEILRRKIMIGEIQPGTHLKEAVLSSEFGVSRGPIREAIVQLENEGLVITPANGRTIVEGFSERDIVNLYRTRFQIEQFALQHFNKDVFVNKEEELTHCVERMEAALRRREKEVDADLQFHYLLVTLSENKTLIQVWKSLYGLIKTVIQVTQDFTLSHEIAVIQEHKRIIDFLKEDDVDNAIEALRHHLKWASKYYQTAVKENKGDEFA